MAELGQVEVGVRVTEVSDYEGWAIVELMGHRRLAGRIRSAVIAGAAMLRIDVYHHVERDDDEPLATQFYAPAAIYAVTPCSEETARRVGGVVAPVQRWELPALPAAATVEQRDEVELEERDEHAGHTWAAPGDGSRGPADFDEER